MRIVQDNDTFFEITEENGVFHLFDSMTKRMYPFKASYEAVWFLIELIRQRSFETLSDENFSDIAKNTNTPFVSIPKSLVSTIKREKINRTYYDQVFMKLLTQLRSGVQNLAVENKTFVVHELTHLIRKSLGTKLTTQAVSPA